MASMYALTRPGKSSTGPFSVKIFRNRGPEIARSHPSPDWDLNRDKRQRSNDGRHRFTTDCTALVNWVRSAASPSWGQLIETAISIRTNGEFLPVHRSISSLAVLLGGRILDG